jgi:hypothetical protein
LSLGQTVHLDIVLALASQSESNGQRAASHRYVANICRIFVDQERIEELPVRSQSASFVLLAQASRVRRYPPALAVRATYWQWLHFRWCEIAKQ